MDNYEYEEEVRKAAIKHGIDMAAMEYEREIWKWIEAHGLSSTVDIVDLGVKIRDITNKIMGEPL